MWTVMNLPLSLGNQIIITIFAKETYGLKLLGLVKAGSGCRKPVGTLRRDWVPLFSFHIVQELFISCNLDFHLIDHIVISPFIYLEYLSGMFLMFGTFCQSAESRFY